MPDFPPLLILIIALAIGFGVVNGFNDAANAVAASVGSRALSPRNAIILAAFFNFAGAATGTAVAITIGQGILAPKVILEFSYVPVIAGLAAVIVWGTIATYYGLPVSITHGFVAGLAAAGIALAGTGAVMWGWGYRLSQTLLAVATAPALGFIGGFALMVILLWVFRRSAPARMRVIFSRLQWLTTAFLAYSHGLNDGQMPIGVITMALVIFYKDTSLWDRLSLWDPSMWWVIAISALAISSGTAIGGWRVIRTVGVKVTALEPIHGFTANISAASVIWGASRFGIPVSTTHCVTSAIMGVGATKRLSAVRWGVARRIVAAWILTFPVCGGLGYLFARLLRPLF
ncbi:MAG: inorganic phosphate transporter [Dehalococcoidia bacterium]|nr:MAG: inorganic phosphate transporter [Dehalococcoidia bacterium]